MTTGLQFVIRHVDTVADVAAARAFYLEKVGLTIDTDTEGFVQFSAPNSAKFGISAGRDDTRAEKVELWWVVDDADKSFAELQASGVEVIFAPKDLPFGRAFAIKDTAGDSCYLLQLPR
jgi:predicted enzyme related to lactoylglutathione lyase